MILRPFKKIKEQEEKIEELLEEIDQCKKKEDNDKHKTGIWCNGCKNLLLNEYQHPIFGNCIDRFCKLDCKCEDRKEDEQ